MNILAIDTSTKACVLGVQKEQQILEHTEIVDRTHSKVILPRINDLLSEAELEPEEIELIIFGQGPGSFTGLRIGIGVVQGLAFGWNVPVVGISSMACLAQSAFRTRRHENSLVALTARNEEVYFGSFSVADGFVSLNEQEAVLEASEIPKQDTGKKWVGLGAGWQLQSQLENAAGIVVEVIYTDVLPAATDLLQLGLFHYSRGLSVSALEAKPRYLREQVASLPQNK